MEAECGVEQHSPNAVEHRLLLGGRFSDGSLGAHHLALVLFFARLTVLVLVGLGGAIFTEDL